MATKKELQEWYLDGKEGIFKGTTHLIHLTEIKGEQDPLEFPQYVFPDETLESKLAQYDEASGLKAVGVFVLDQEFEAQYKEKYQVVVSWTKADTLTVFTADICSQLRDISSSYGRRYCRFVNLFAKHLEKHETVTVSGFIFAAESAMSDPEGQFEHVDRIKLRNDFPNLVDYAFGWPQQNDPRYEFVQELKKEFAEIKAKTLNFF